jgi:HPt (histidine-containing phosphotransfer) domain-containing protein
MSDDDARAELAALAVEYAAHLPALVQALAARVVEAQAHPAAVPEARRAAHTLRGTAGSYGFAAVGEAAGRIEDALEEMEEGAPRGDLAPLVAALLATAPHSRSSSGSSK